MNLIYSVILCLFFKTSSCQLKCVKETLYDHDFFINVTTHFKAETGDCIRIPYKLMIPTNKVTAPYRKIWFKGDPQNAENTIVVNTVESEMKDTYSTGGLPPGEYEYGFKLEWECNQTYIFPMRVRISVSALTQKPYVYVPALEEGRGVRLQCRADRLCSSRAQVSWKKTTAGGQSILQDVNEDFYNREIGRYRGMYMLNYIPTADDHNINITCLADYGYTVAETTVTLNVKFSPKILNSSQCMTDGKLVVCVCNSRGNPLAPITWPLASLTDFSVTSSSSILTVSSTITMPAAADYHNTSVKCISSNEMGQAEIDIPLQDNSKNFPTDLYGGKQTFNTTTPWIIVGVSFSLNLLLLILIISIYRRDKQTQMKVCEETDTYASLRKADVEQEYSVISPQPR
ncbi:uncharacterized protein LOC131972700 [Centropristis striata]|uniref:uncharacterized protein LOC131972700 n=1 Tax=Centropristis striata TaxID=184440 RepID=UPI0027E1E584|nr:uncharacterized protein LOC131972700 [Centropristis striata]